MLSKFFFFFFLMTIQHPLSNSWSFWTVLINKNYEIEEIDTFSTVEDFWNVFIQLPSILNLRNVNLALFRDKIRPAWEDKENIGNQNVRYFLNDSFTPEKYENIVLTIIGSLLKEKFCLINGLIYLAKDAAQHLEIWFSNEIIIDEKFLKEFNEYLNLNYQFKIRINKK